MLREPSLITQSWDYAKIESRGGGLILTASSSVLTKTKMTKLLTKLTRFKEHKILIIFDFRTHPEVKRLINRNADILNDTYMNLIMGISADQLPHLVVGWREKSAKPV